MLHDGVLEFNSIANGGQPSAIGASLGFPANWVMDGGRNRVETVVPIVEMYVSKGSKSPTWYELTLNTENGKKSVKVGKEFYNTLQVGDEVKLVTSTGPLGITYHYAREAGS